MNEESEILIPLKAFVIKIFKISLNVRTLSERSIKNSDTFVSGKVSVIKIFKVLLNVRTLREESRHNKNSDIS